MPRLAILAVLAGGALGAARPPADELAELQADYTAAQAQWHQQLGTQPAATRPAAERPPHPREAFVPRFRAFAEKYAGKSEALSALMWLATEGARVRSPGEGESPAAWALARLARDHAADPALADKLSRLFYAVYDVDADTLIEFYRRVLAVNRDKEARARATLNLGFVFYHRAETAEGEAAAADRRQALELFRRCVRDYPQTPAAERAGGFVFELENLQIGMVAPEIVGQDLDGNEIRLSQFRGRVVVVNFWGHW